MSCVDNWPPPSGHFAHKKHFGVESQCVWGQFYQCILPKHQGYLLWQILILGDFISQGVAHRKGWTCKKTMSVPLTDDAWDLLYASTLEPFP